MFEHAVLTSDVRSDSGRKNSSKTFLNLLPLILGVLTLASLMLPEFIGKISGYLYHVRGIDLIFGRQVANDADGIIPQVGAFLVGLSLVFGILCLVCLKNKMKAVFLNCVLSFLGLMIHSLLPIQLMQKSSNLQIDKISYGFYIVELCLIALLAAGVINIIRNEELCKDLKKRFWLYVLGTVVVGYCLVFFYYPMYGIIIAFKDYSPKLGILGSEWVGFEHFKSFFNSYYFIRLLKNTFSISMLDILFGFTSPIIFALLLNEVRNKYFKSVIQTVTYMPYFVSLVVICGLLVDFLSGNGLITNILAMFGVEKQNFLLNSKYFQGIYTASGVWQNLGWNSIIYLAALTGIDDSLYEAASVDGANRWHMMRKITLPCIMPTIIIMFILRLGNVMNVGYEKIILLYNPATYETADVISSFVYRRGIIEMGYSFSTAVSLFNSLINFAFLLTANKLSKKFSEVSLW